MQEFTSIDPLAELYYSWSPYAYVGNNPLRRKDPNGKDWLDILHGTLSAVADNVSWGASSYYSEQQQQIVSDANDYNIGRGIGDAVSILAGASQVTSGTAGVVLGVVTSETGVGAVGGGAAVVKVVHGAGMIVNALQGKGRMEAKKNGNSSSSSSSGNSKGGGKNSQHANQKAREAAKKNYDAAKGNYDALKSKPNKTPDDKKALDAAKRQMDQAKQKMDFTGENHSQKAKGNK